MFPLRKFIEEKKPEIPNPEMEYRIPIEKVKVITNGMHGNLVITEMEQVISKQKVLRKNSKNPNKKILFQLRNNIDEQIQIVHYKGNDYFNVFVDGGVHESRFMLTESKAQELVRILSTSTSTRSNTVYTDNEVKS